MHPNLRESARLFHLPRTRYRGRRWTRRGNHVRSSSVSSSALRRFTSWESLPDPEARAPKAELGLSNLFDEIRITVGQEAQIITAVFPNPAVVMQVFLQRVFAQVVRPLLLAMTRKS